MSFFCWYTYHLSYHMSLLPLTHGTPLHVCIQRPQDTAPPGSGGVHSPDMFFIILYMYILLYMKHGPSARPPKVYWRWHLSSAGQIKRPAPWYIDISLEHQIRSPSGAYAWASPLGAPTWTSTLGQATPHLCKHPAKRHRAWRQQGDKQAHAGR